MCVLLKFKRLVEQPCCYDLLRLSLCFKTSFKSFFFFKQSSKSSLLGEGIWFQSLTLFLPFFFLSRKCSSLHIAVASLFIFFFLSLGRKGFPPQIVVGSFHFFISGLKSKSLLKILVGVFSF